APVTHELAEGNRRERATLQRDKGKRRGAPQHTARQLIPASASAPSAPSAAAGMHNSQFLPQLIALPSRPMLHLLVVWRRAPAGQPAVRGPRVGVGCCCGATTPLKSRRKMLGAPPRRSKQPKPASVRGSGWYASGRCDP